MHKNIVGSQCSQSCAPPAKLSPWTRQQLLNHLFLHTPSNTMAKHSGYQSGKKKEQKNFSTLAGICWSAFTIWTCTGRGRTLSSLKLPALHMPVKLTSSMQMSLCGISSSIALQCSKSLWSPCSAASSAYTFRQFGKEVC